MSSALCIEPLMPGKGAVHAPRIGAVIVEATAKFRSCCSPWVLDDSIARFTHRHLLHLDHPCRWQAMPTISSPFATFKDVLMQYFQTECACCLLWKMECWGVSKVLSHGLASPNKAGTTLGQSHDHRKCKIENTSKMPDFLAFTLVKPRGK